QIAPDPRAQSADARERQRGLRIPHDDAVETFLFVDVLDDLCDSGAVSGLWMLRRDRLEVAVADDAHILEPLQCRYDALAGKRVATEHDHLATELLRQDFHDALDPDGRAVDEVESDAGVDQDLHGSLLDFARNVCDIS